ncbi:hypothetical protein [Tropicibacter naphthalenivorans]|uniref:Uncharacterized protein n=1 Tax=Tropicibacter naphthalenivorans TaxID=441103 RepID=A0A0N7LYL8_9RHOB|nr:hypothetical protein [Tropicibacter naphthalenivorans]CUH75225.1 hypothetical protein TRN7648_00330 [Tropicibacter naphthalenivorans]SMC45519.1 hypothetical protein SAMN04488093_101550 [Tropicibacter naphthalenivorans]
MTALKEFERLEATGLWRASPEDQRREVIVSLGDATLTMSDMNNTALAHWSLGAVMRANGTQTPAIYHPDGDPDETLEIAANETEMIEGIDRLLRAIDKKRPKPGKLRLILGLGAACAIAAGAIFWLPDALERYTVTVVPDVKRAEIGEALLANITRVTGQPCMTPEAGGPLAALRTRILQDGQRLVIVPGGTRMTAHLPGGIYLMNRALVEDFEDPDVPAGYLVVEQLRAAQADALAEVVDHAGLMASLRLLTTGKLPDSALDSYAETLMSAPQDMPPADQTLTAFAQTELRSAPYAYAQDITGETTLPLIEGDPLAGRTSRQVLSDGDWVRLQGICGG